MTVSFAMLESQIQSLLGLLLYQPQRVGQIVSTYLSFSNLRAAVVTLYAQRFGENAGFITVRSLIARAGKIEEERNRLTHSAWGAGDTAESITRIKITCRERHGFQLASEQYDDEKLRAFVVQIKILADEIGQFYVSLMQPAVTTGGDPI